MAFVVTIEGLLKALGQLSPNAAFLGDQQIGLFVNDFTPDVNSVDEDDYTEPGWDGYAKAVSKPWTAPIRPAGEDYARTTSALCTFEVDSDPGAEVVYGWFAYDDTLPLNERVTFAERFPAPVTPIQDTPINFVARFILRNCAE